MIIACTAFWNNFHTTLLLISSVAYKISFMSTNKPEVATPDGIPSMVMPVVFQRKLSDAPKKNRNHRIRIFFIV